MKIAYYLPEAVFSNSEFEALGWPAEKIFKKTGIKNRHVTGENEFALDLAVKACERLFKEAAVDKPEVDFLLYCTQSPDYLIPTNACILHEKLGLKKSAGALDINLGCSGFLYGLSLAKGLLLSGQARSVLLVTADTYTKYINKKDKTNRVIFGDAAAATYLDKADALKIGDFVFGTDGSGAENLCVKTGGLRHRKTELTALEKKDKSGNVRSEDNLFMDGPEILSFTLVSVPKAVQEILTRAGLRLEDIDYFLFHQANAFILESLREKLGIPPEKFPIDMEDIGNTVSCTIPILLNHLHRDKKIKPGQRILLAAFGVGYSWIATLLNA